MKTILVMAAVLALAGLKERHYFRCGYVRMAPMAIAPDDALRHDGAGHRQEVASRRRCVAASPEPSSGSLISGRLTRRGPRGRMEAHDGVRLPSCQQLLATQPHAGSARDQWPGLQVRVERTLPTSRFPCDAASVSGSALRHRRPRSRGRVTPEGAASRQSPGRL